MKLKKNIESILGLLVAILVWELYTRVSGIYSFVLPPPSKVFPLIFTFQPLRKHFFVTLYEALGGFGVSAVLGILFGIMIIHSKRVERGLYPIMVAAQVVPVNIFAIIFVVWFGFGMLPNIMVAFLITFFPILVNMITGLAITEPELLDLMNSMRASRLQILFKIRLPNSLPYMFSAFKIAAPEAVAGAIVSEFIGGTEGLGFLTLMAQRFLLTDLVFAALISMAFMGLAIFIAVLIAEKLFMSWYKR